MKSHFPSQPRREFLRRSSQGMAALGTTVGFSSLILHSPGSASAESIPQTKRPSLFPTGAGRARRIAVGPYDQIYIAADREILIFDAAGQKRNRIKLPRPARCLAVDQTGQVYVGLMDHLRVFDSQGKEIAAWKDFSAKTILSGMALTDRNVFLADAGQQLIWRLDRHGTILGQIEGKNGFSAPAEFFLVEIGTDGNLRVANSARHRIESYQPDGTFLGAWGERSRTIEGFSGCCNPVSLVPLPNGKFLTAERGLPRVKLYNETGKFQKQLAGPEQFTMNARASSKDNAPGCTSGGLDVAVDSTGAAIVLDRVTGNVHRFPV